jgi:glyoxylase-like metal-dependent hydrolase (beta-lactamase superfamily II)
MMIPIVKSFFDEATNTATYVVSEPTGKHCAIIDSVLDYDAHAGRTSTASADAVIAYIRKKALNCEWILETHAHADHLSAAHYLRDHLDAKIAIGEHIPDIQRVFGGIFNAGEGFPTDGSQFDSLFKDGETFHIGNMPVQVMFTPGHTPACVSYHIGDAVFVGDTLFMPDYGTARCDFPGGDAAMLYRSIQKLFELRDETRVFLCHDYKATGRDYFEWETTVGMQKSSNVHIREGISEGEFVEMRQARDKTLGLPKLILPSIQVNMRAGEMPPPEYDGHHYLKIPINRD